MTKIRFRADHRYIAELKGLGKRRVEAGDSPDWCTQEEWDATEPAQPGDTWRTRWYSETSPDHLGPVAGYDICCVKCKQVHAWTTATNCSSRQPILDAGTGKVIGYKCAHSGSGSCWTWTGSAEDGTLDAKPSLYCQEALGGCGYHGWLNSGDLSAG